MKSGILRQVPKLHMYSETLSIPRVENKPIFTLCAPFTTYGPIFKISIFGHEMWNLKEGRKVACVLFLPQSVEIKVIFALQAIHY